MGSCCKQQQAFIPNAEQQYVAISTEMKSFQTTTDITVLSSERLHHPNVANFLLIWLDVPLDSKSNNGDKSREELQRLVHNIEMFSYSRLCIDFIKTVKEEQIILIISGSLGERLIPDIHSMHMIHIIYIFCLNKANYQPPMENYSKVKGIFTQVKPLCEELKKNISEAERDLISMEFIDAKSDGNNKQEAIFMYAQLFKDILLDLSASEDIIAFKIMVAFCRQQYQSNPNELELIDEFERNYHPSKAVWWYTRECLLYKILHKAFRVQTHTIIYTFRSFILELHTQLNQLAANRKETMIITLCRGQSLANADFKKLERNRDGLLSFNNFLSTSTSEDVALNFARQSKGKKNMIGVVFQISVRSTVESSTKYANIQTLSYFGKTEEEYLFGMGAIFRVEPTEPFEEGLVCVRLTLTKTNDPQLNLLDKFWRKLFLPEEMKIAIKSQRTISLATKLSALMFGMSDPKRASSFFSNHSIDI
ncbi:unnamed protein product [Rotaria magnacalcarata]|uniref:Uncharacterized protein n=1 Tax=Rotaria magnacalcarata TaxID=392030 RepID=A0A816WAB9_9BILA|nr:unnamed protein product [Rotaria magnacalcarata]